MHVVAKFDKNVGITILTTGRGTPGYQVRGERVEGTRPGSPKANNAVLAGFQ